MSEQYNDSSSTQSQPTPAQVNQQNQQNINQTQGVSPDQNNAEVLRNHLPNPVKRKGTYPKMCLVSVP